MYCIYGIFMQHNMGFWGNIKTTYLGSKNNILFFPLVMTNIKKMRKRNVYL